MCFTLMYFSFSRKFEEKYFRLVAKKIFGFLRRREKKALSPNPENQMVSALQSDLIVCLCTFYTYQIRVQLNFQQNPQMQFFSELSHFKTLPPSFFHQYVAGYHLIFHISPIFPFHFLMQNCSWTWFGCKSGTIQCIDFSFRCDGTNDCDDGSDESVDIAGCDLCTALDNGSGKNFTLKFSM